MSLFQIICLICHQRGGTLRRIKPAKLYACAGCVKTHGGIDFIYANVGHFIDEFRAWQAQQTTGVTLKE